MEPRGCLGQYDAYEDRYAIRATIQSAHGIRAILAEQIFGLPQGRFRVVCDNMGGGFGTRGGCLPEYALALWASEVVGRPVKWVAERSECLLTDEQARGGFVDAELALDSEYRFLALRTHTKVPIGAYYTSDRNFGSTVTGLGGLAGVYRTPAIHARVTGAFTNTMTNAQYRGGAKPEPCHVIEVMVDVAARELGVDPARLREINTLDPGELPHRTCLGAVYDCGEFPANQARALQTGGYADFETRRAEALEKGKLLGIGMSQTISGVAMTNYEHAEIRFDSGGGITLLTGAMDHGQGHGTTFRQVLADRLGIDMDDIRYRYGDTDAVTAGVGTFNARCAALAGSAVVQAAEKIVGKGRRIAAHMLEAAEADIEFSEGRFGIAGTDRSVGLAEIARAAFQKPRLPADIEPGLYERGDFGSDDGPVYPNGFHLAEVEIDRETGRVRLARYNCVDDAGTVLNPILFDAQVHGGIVQGAGQILMEDVAYDRGRPAPFGLLHGLRDAEGRRFLPFRARRQRGADRAQPARRQGGGRGRNRRRDAVDHERGQRRAAPHRRAAGRNAGHRGEGLAGDAPGGRLSANPGHQRRSTGSRSNTLSIETRAQLSSSAWAAGSRTQGSRCAQSSWAAHSAWSWSMASSSTALRRSAARNSCGGKLTRLRPALSSIS